MKIWVTKNQHQIYRLLRGRSNVFAISNGNSLIIIDTSIKICCRILCRKIDDVLSNNVEAAALILTHAHYDHASNAASLKERYKLKLIAQKHDAKYLVSGDNPIPTGTNAAARLLTNTFTKMNALQLMKYIPVTVDFEVDDYYDLSSLGFNAYIIHTPGHTEGSLSIIVDDEIAVVGDAMFGIFKNSVYPPFAANPQRMVESWKRLLDTGCSLFLPSHGTENSRELVLKQYKYYSSLCNK